MHASALHAKLKPGSVASGVAMGRGFGQAGGIVGGFCAAFLAYIALGGTLALAIAQPYNVDQNCWPHQTLLGIIRTECASSLADAAWYVSVETPRYFVVMPTLALVQLIQVVQSGSTYWLGEAWSWGRYGAPVLAAGAIGFLHLRARLPALAWVLLVLLVGQIAFEAAPHVTPQQVEPM
jgi:hypothetical protein